MKKFSFSMAMLALVLVFGLAFVGCKSDTTKEAFGLSFSDKIITKDFRGGEVIAYILNHTYSEALAIITEEIGQPGGGAAGLQGDNALFDVLNTKSSYVVLQDCVGLNEYRLCYRNASGEWGGIAWNK